jgi:two-component system, cell cycle sensor histidine kinase and response regulator CckA
MGDASEGAQGSRGTSTATGVDLFFDLSVDLLTIAGADGRFRRLNPAWEGVLGYSLAELYAMSWSDLVHPDDQARTLSEFGRADKSSMMFFENRYRHRNGSYRWLEWSTIRIPAEQVYYAVARDVTERRAERERLRASEAYKSAVHEASTDAIVAFDAEGRVVDFNAAAERMYGYRAEQVKARSLTDFAIPPDRRAAFEATLARYRKAPGGIVDFRVEEVGLRADGSRFPLELTVTRLEAGPAVFAAFIRDLTDGKRADRERRSLEDQLRQAQKMEAVGRLAGNVAHDFNDLLRAITSFADVAGSALAPAGPARERLERMKKATERAVSLVDQLLVFGRRQALSPKVLDVNDAIHELEHILRGLTGDDVSFQLALDPDVGRVRADPAQLQQALVNLVVNAREAMRVGGRLRITTSNVELAAASLPPGVGAKPGAYVRIAVEDNGVGMTEEVAAKAITPFFTTKTGAKDSGSGLGLSQVYGFVRASGGDLEIKTQPGRGTSIGLFLPRAVS